MKEFFPDNAVEYFVSYYDYYQPEAYVPTTDTFIEKDASINDHIEQMRLSATKALLERRDVVIVASVSAIYGLGIPRPTSHDAAPQSGDDQSAGYPAPPRRTAVHPQRHGLPARHLPGAGEVIDIYPAESDKLALRVELFDEEVERLSCSILDRRHRADGGALHHLPQDPLRHPAGDHSGCHRWHIKGGAQGAARGQLMNLNKLVEEQHQPTHPVRHGDDAGAGLLLRHKENYSRYLSGRAPASRRPPCLTTCRGTACSSSTNPTSRCRRSAPCSNGDRSRKETLVEYGFPPSLGAGQPAPQVRRVRGADAPDGVRLGDPGPTGWISQAVTWCSRWCVPTGLLDPEVEVRPVAPRWTICSPRSASGWRWRSGCWSRP